MESDQHVQILMVVERQRSNFANHGHVKHGAWGWEILLLLRFTLNVVTPTIDTSSKETGRLTTGVLHTACFWGLQCKTLRFLKNYNCQTENNITKESSKNRAINLSNLPATAFKTMQNSVSAAVLESQNLIHCINTAMCFWLQEFLSTETWIITTYLIYHTEDACITVSLSCWSTRPISPSEIVASFVRVETTGIPK